LYCTDYFQTWFVFFCFYPMWSDVLWSFSWEDSIHSVYPKQWQVVLATALCSCGESLAHQSLGWQVSGPLWEALCSSQISLRVAAAVAWQRDTPACDMHGHVFFHTTFYVHLNRKPLWMLLWKTATLRIKLEICNRPMKHPWTSCGKSRGS
jgi:hypothetical protein